jgi:hypothetical protein
VNWIVHIESQMSRLRMLIKSDHANRSISSISLFAFYSQWWAIACRARILRSVHACEWNFFSIAPLSTANFFLFNFFLCVTQIIYFQTGQNVKRNVIFSSGLCWSLTMRKIANLIKITTLFIYFLKRFFCTFHFRLEMNFFLGGCHQSSVKLR